jgi:hypothetical protein
MIRQRRLAEAAELDLVTVQVLPVVASRHTALGSGFTLLNFGDLGEPDIADVEHTLGALFLEKDNDVTRARLAFDRLRADALDPAESLAPHHYPLTEWRAFLAGVKAGQFPSQVASS